MVIGRQTPQPPGSNRGTPPTESGIDGTRNGEVQRRHMLNDRMRNTRPAIQLIEDRIDIEETIVAEAKAKTLGDVVQISPGIEHVCVLADQQQPAAGLDEAFDMSDLIGLITRGRHLHHQNIAVIQRVGIDRCLQPSHLIETRAVIVDTSVIVSRLLPIPVGIVSSVGALPGRAVLIDPDASLLPRPRRVPDESHRQQQRPHERHRHRGHALRFRRWWRGVLRRSGRRHTQETPGQQDRPGQQQQVHPRIPELAHQNQRRVVHGSQGPMQVNRD